MLKGLQGGLFCALLLAGVLAAPAGAAGSLLAPPSKCGGQKSRGAKEHRQEKAMRCLIGYARQRSGVSPLRPQKALARAAGSKAGDLERCGFSHNACGRPVDYWPRKTGYASGSWLVGENIAWGRGRRGSARSVMADWLASPPHRAVILGSRFEHSGLGLRTKRGVAYWALQVGCHHCS